MTINEMIKAVQVFLGPCPKTMSSEEITATMCQILREQEQAHKEYLLAAAKMICNETNPLIRRVMIANVLLGFPVYNITYEEN